MAPNDTTTGDEATLFPSEQGNEQSADAPAPRRRATRRTTKKATTIVPSAEAPAEAPADAATEASTDEPAAAAAPEGVSTGDAPAEATAPETKRPARKRATRKKATVAAPVEPAPDTDGPSPVAEVSEVSEVSTEPAPAEKAPRAERAPRAARATKRGSRTKADRANAAVEELVAGALSGDDATTESPADASAATYTAADPAAIDLSALIDVDALDESEDLDDAASAVDADDDRQGAVVPSFSMPFQAPDASQAVPTRRRRGTPPPEAEEPTSDVEDDEPTVADEDQTDVDEQTDEQTDEESSPRRSRRRRGGKGRRGRATDDDEAQDQQSETDERDSRDSRRSADARGESAEGADDAESDADSDSEGDSDDEGGSSRRRRRRRRAGSAPESGDDTPNVSTRVRQPRSQSDEPVAVKGSTRLEAKKQRRREGREAGRRRTIITEAEFLARREAVDRVMVVRNKEGRTQMGVLEDGVLVEHYIDQATNVSMAGNIYLGRVQNVLPSMEAAFVDIGKGRNAVLYAGEVNWDAAGLEANQPKRIENALGSGQTVLVQVTKDPIGHKGARLTSQISLPGRYLVYVPNSSMTGISRKLPDTERARLKKILRDVVPDSAGVIVRTAAEGASEEELRADVERLTRTWEDIQAKAEAASTPRAGKSKGKKKNGAAGSVTGGQAPMLLHGEPDLTVRVIRDVFNEDFKQLVVAGDQAWNEIHPYISSVAPDLADRVTKWTAEEDLFTHHRVDEQLSKAMDRKVWLPSGGSLVIDRTEAMTVVDVNTGKFVGSGGNLEETVTKNNIEAAEEIVRQLRLRDIGGIIVIDFIDMVLESNRDLVVRRLLECLGRDRTKHQVAEVTSLGLVQMTRKRVGSGLIEVFSETCDHCNGRGFIIHTDPVDKGAHAHEQSQGDNGGGGGTSRRRGRAQGAGQASGQGGTQGNGGQQASQQSQQAPQAESKGNGPTAAQIAAAAHAAALKSASGQPAGEAAAEAVAEMSAEMSTEVHDGKAFPQDDGPWSGDDAHDADAADEQATQGGAHVELESDVLDETGSGRGAGHAAAAEVAPASPEVSAETSGPAPVEAVVEVQPAARGRRRRGRVVAPAGPPRASGDAGGESGSTGGA